VDARNKRGHDVQGTGTRLEIEMKPKTSAKQLVVCVDNDGYAVSLEKRKIYVALRDADADAEKHNLRRVVDESGEDYLYPKAFFRAIALPQAVRKPSWPPHNSEHSCGLWQPEHAAEGRYSVRRRKRLRRRPHRRGGRRHQGRLPDDHQLPVRPAGLLRAPGLRSRISPMLNPVYLLPVIMIAEKAAAMLRRRKLGFKEN
jgi:hypothetical protein